MLALTRGVVSFHEHLVRNSVEGFDSTLAPLMRRLRRRTFGVVGFGRIGAATALRAKAFGFKVLGYDPYVSAGTEIALGIERLDSLEELLGAADVVSLHCPLTRKPRA
jgi:D-3-phosphoglycerate dehydrogenase/C-terminal binding protein